jgi:hypothetical protein
MGVFPGSINHIFWLHHYGLRVVMDKQKSRNVAIFLHQKQAKTKNEDLPKKAVFGSLGT